LKIFILIELFRRVFLDELDVEEEIIYDEKYYVEGSGILRYLSKGIKIKIIDLLSLMIILSDNVAANILIEYLGLEKINETLINLNLKNSKIYSKFNFPVERLSEMTAMDYAAIFRKIAKRELYSEDISQQMLDVLSKQQSYQMLLSHEMNRSLRTKYFKENKNSEGKINYIASKSGKWSSTRNDGGIVSTIYGDYVLVILIKGFDDKHLLNDEVCNIGKKISELVFEEYINLKS